MALDELLGVVASRLGDFRETDHLGFRVAEQAMDMALALFARSDDGHVDTVVWRFVAFGCPDMRRQDEGGAYQSRCLEEFATRERFFDRAHGFIAWLSGTKENKLNYGTKEMERGKLQ